MFSLEELFCRADDFCQRFESIWQRQVLSSGLWERKRDRNPDISRPFFHMKSGKFWHLYANPGFEKVLAKKIKLKTLAEVKRAISHAYLDKDLFDFLQEQSLRDSLRSVLVSRWFPGRLDQVKQIS